MNCPCCQRLIYSRQPRRCGFCRAELPSELLLEPHEVDDLKNEIRDIEKRSAIDLEKEAAWEAELKSRRRRD